MSENEVSTTLASDEQIPLKEAVKETAPETVEKEPPLANGEEHLPPAPPSPKEGTQGPETEKEGELKVELKEEEPPAAVPTENGDLQDVSHHQEAPEEAHTNREEEELPAEEANKSQEEPAVEEAHTNREEEPAAEEPLRAPEEETRVVENNVEEKTESPLAKPTAPTAINGREAPMTETVGATEMTRMANFGFNYTKLVRGKPRGPLLPDAYLKFADKLYNFEFRNEDVMVMGFPRSGTTWDAVFPGDLGDETRSDIQKFRELYPGENPEDGVVLKLAEADKSPRHFVTHMPPQLHNPEMLNACKVIYVARNPKDVCLSWYNFSCNLQLESQKYFEGEFSEFVEGFKAGYVLYSPFWEHISQAWQKRHHRNLHFLFYEDLKTDIMGELRRLSSFLRLGLGDDQLKKVSELTSFQSMKGREDKLPIVKELQSSFFHKGEVGSWEGTASPLVDARMVAWINENLQGTGIKFAFN